MKTILCPTDFSEHSENAIRYAAQIAKKTDASLYLMHALHVPVIDAYAPAETLNMMMIESEKAATKRMDNRAEELSKELGVRLITKVTFGLATDLVTKLEKELDIDLVVVATHGANNAIDKWLGTTAAQIVAESVAPTIVIPSGASFDGLDRVGYATDFTQDSDKMIEAFTKIVKPFDSKIFVVHVTTDRQSDDERDRFVAHFSDISNPITVTGDNIPEELNAFIWDNNLHLLGLKRHKRSWFDNLFHTSVTKQMIYHSKVPIIVFS